MEDPSLEEETVLDKLTELERRVFQLSDELTQAREALQLEGIQRQQIEEFYQSGHDELDGRLQERTHDLELANENLQAEMKERERLQAALDQTHELMETIFASTADAMFIKDLKGRYVMMNPAGAALLGRPLDEILGHEDAHLFSSETTSRLLEHDRRVIDSEETETCEERLVSETIERVVVSTRAPWRDVSGKIAGVFGISRPRH